MHSSTYENLDERDKIQSQPVPLPLPSPSTIEVPMDAVTWKDFIIGLIVVHGVPLSMFSGEVFKSAFGGLSASLGVSLDRENIRKLVLDRYNEDY